MKTAHEWAVELTHARIAYGTILEGRADVLAMLKKTIFSAARDVIAEVQKDAVSATTPQEKC